MTKPNSSIRGVGAFLLVIALWLMGGAPTHAQECDPNAVSLAPLIDEAFTRPASFDWQGDWLQDDFVCFPSRQSGAELRSYLLAPADIATRTDRLPVVVIGPGSGSGQALYYLWSARELAGHGYLALVVDPQGVGRSEINGDPEQCDTDGCPGVPFQQASNYVDAFLSSLDFVGRRGHPWLQKADLTSIGIAGHSLSARAAAFVQGEDFRVQAVVAWDNLSSDLNGDAGISSGGGTCGSLIGGELPSEVPVTVRVPAMGQASDRPPTCDVTGENNHPQVKKTAYEVWKQAGVPSMQLVFNDAAHADWAQARGSDPLQLQLFQYYTRAWFDLYLKGDESAALARLVDRNPLGQMPEEVFSTQFESALFIPQRVTNCESLLNDPCELRDIVDNPVPPLTPSSSGGSVSLPALFAMLLLTATRRSSWLTRLFRRLSSSPEAREVS